MLVFIENTPRSYAWGSRTALPELFGLPHTGEPQAELWLGAHPGGPARVVTGAGERISLAQLIAGDPGAYGPRGGELPFLLKALAIAAPLSLQVHPDRGQAERGFLAEGGVVGADASDRNYRDANHKPELLVALTPVCALAGFRSLAAVLGDFAALQRICVRAGDRVLGGVFDRAVDVLRGGGSAAAARREFIGWALLGEGRRLLADACARFGRVLAVGVSRGGTVDEFVLPGLDSGRVANLRLLVEHYPRDPGVFVSLLLHLEFLVPGEAIFLAPGQLHAYVSGVGVEVMAASDNVLRAGLTGKHVDAVELLRVLDAGSVVSPRLPHVVWDVGVCAWCPAVDDFMLVRVELLEGGRSVCLCPLEPLIVFVVAGRLRLEREVDVPGVAEVVSAGRGQALYVSQGGVLRFSGVGVAFVAAPGGGVSIRR